jgi:hypothetical protein
VILIKTEKCVRAGVTYRVETTWDDESGDAEVREFTLDCQLVRSSDWRIWPEDERREDQIGEVTWFDSSGAEIERRVCAAERVHRERDAHDPGEWREDEERADRDLGNR